MLQSRGIGVLQRPRSGREVLHCFFFACLLFINTTIKYIYTTHRYSGEVVVAPLLPEREAGFEFVVGE